MSSSTDPLSSSGAARGTAFWDRVERALQFIGPSGVGLAALYFLGQVYSSEYYGYFGIDPAIVDVAISEQAAQSKNVIFPILAVGLFSWLATILVAAIGSALASSNLSAQVKRRLHIVSICTAIFTFITLLMIWFFANVRISVLAFTTIIVLTGSISVSAIRRLATSAMGTVAAVAPETRRLKVVIWCILVFTAFISAIYYARVVGRADGRDTSLHISLLPHVAIKSEQPLDFPDTAPLSILPGAQSTFRYVYADFYVLKHTDTRWLLIPPKWKRGGGKVYVLMDDKDVRVEFISR